MGFFFSDTIKKSKTQTTQLSKHGCIVCPLKGRGVLDPKLMTKGSESSEIYILQESPRRINIHDEVFSDETSQFLLNNLYKVFPTSYIDQQIRWNYVVTCKPKEESPSDFEIECCKSRLLQDI